MEQCVLCLGPHATITPLLERNTCQPFFIHQACESRWNAFYHNQCIMCRNQQCYGRPNHEYLDMNEFDTDAVTIPYEQTNPHNRSHSSSSASLDFSYMCSPTTKVVFCVGAFCLLALFVGMAWILVITKP